MTFDDARAACRDSSEGGDLVTVDTADLQGFVMGQMKRISLPNLWIGAMMTKTDWRWVTSK